MCEESEHKYRCPRCLTLTCSLKCVIAHKVSLGCSGLKEKEPVRMLKLGEMSTGSMRQDMKMLESGINLSNKAKKENVLSKVGASITLGLKPADPKLVKKQKNLKHFLRKKRGVDYFTSPSPLFSRNKLNQTHLSTQVKPPVVLWTLEIKFLASAARGKQHLSEVVLH